MKLKSEFKGWWHWGQRCCGKPAEELEETSGGSGAIQARDQGIGFNRPRVWWPGRDSEFSGVSIQVSSYMDIISCLWKRER